jgi:hypothetical protein
VSPSPVSQSPTLRWPMRQPPLSRTPSRHCCTTTPDERMVLHGQRLGIKADPELLYVGAMFHELGLVEGHRNLTQRFEVDGADAARDFLLSHDVPADAVRLVWLSIALHSTHGIPRFMEPEIALLAAGVRVDVDGAGLDLLDPAVIEEIIAVHPRCVFKRQALKPSAKGARSDPIPSSERSQRICSRTTHPTSSASTSSMSSGTTPGPNRSESVFEKIDRRL